MLQNRQVLKKYICTCTDRTEPNRIEPLSRLAPSTLFMMESKRELDGPLPRLCQCCCRLAGASAQAVGGAVELGSTGGHQSHLRFMNVQYNLQHSGLWIGAFWHHDA